MIADRASGVVGPPRHVPADSALSRTLTAGGLVIVVSGQLGLRGRGGIAGVAALMSPANATTMAIHGRGLLSVVVYAAAAVRLGLEHMPGPLMRQSGRPLFLSSIEAADCTGTGISASDRAMTMRAAGNPLSSRRDLRTPGHIMPILVAGNGDSEELPERSYNLVKQCTSYDVMAWCDLLNDTGECASVDECVRKAATLNLPLVHL